MISSAGGPPLFRNRRKSISARCCVRFSAGRYDRPAGSAARNGGLPGFQYHRVEGTYKWIDELEKRPQNKRFRFVNLGVGGDLSFIVRKLQRGANSRIGLSSLAPLGEDPDSRDPVQARLNDLITTYNDIIANIASNERTDYIPFNESFQGQLARARTPKAFTHFAIGSLYRDYVLREMILRQSFDKISRINGWEFHIDGIHLNSKVGEY
jgi:hypothetical protein